jgi:hypothetical protein
MPVVAAGEKAKAFIMDYINLMFLAMVGLVIFLSCVYISSWVRWRKTRYDSPQLSLSVPPRKRTISGQVQVEGTSAELGDRMAEWQRLHKGFKRPLMHVAGQIPPNTGDYSRKVEEFSRRLH